MNFDLQIYQVIALATLAGVVLAQWLRTKRLETKLEHVTQSMLQLIDESEAATSDLRRSLAEINHRESAVEISPSSISSGDAAATDELWNIDRRHRVLTLAKHGLTAGEIARRLCLPDGEIQLMLSMSQPVVH